MIPRACYFEQAANGRYIRMALILKLLAEKDVPSKLPHDGEVIDGLCCQNPRCITTTEQELPQLFRCADHEHEIYRCVYCDQKVYKKK